MVNVNVRYDPDFKPNAKRTIDLRPFFEDQEEEYGGDTLADGTAEMPENYTPARSPIVSPAIREEERRERVLKIEREERALAKPVRRMFLEWLRDISEAFVIFLIGRFQDFDRYMNPFETKHTEEQLAYLALSLPNSVRTAEQVLLYFPLMSRTQRYRMLRMRKDKLAMYERVFKKNR